MLNHIGGGRTLICPRQFAGAGACDAMRGPRHKRQMVGLLLAVCFAMTGAGCATSGIRGVVIVGTDTDGMLFAVARHLGEDAAIRYYSDDNGLSWKRQYPTTIAETRQSEMTLGGVGVATPHGYYDIYEASIIGGGDGKQETVHSVDYLRDKANIILQYQANPVPDPQDLTTEPYAVHYDAPSGNVIAAMGHLGVVVRTPDGQWTSAPVGPARPIDFSAPARLLLMTGLPGFWVASLLLMLSLSSFTVILSRCQWKEIFWAAAISAIAAGAVVITFLIGSVYPLITLIVSALLLYALLAGPSASSRRKGAVLVVAGLILAAAAWLFPGFILALVQYWHYLTASLLLIPAAVAAGLTIAAAWPYRPRGPDLAAALVALAAMTLAILATTTLWMMYVLSASAAKAIAIALPGTVAVALFAWLKLRHRRGRRRNKGKEPPARPHTQPTRADRSGAVEKLLDYRYRASRCRVSEQC